MKEDPRSEATLAIIEKAEHLRLERLQSVARDRGLDFSGTVADLEFRLLHAPDQMAVDFCVEAQHNFTLPSGQVVPVCPTPLVRPEEQVEEFRPYENCVNPKKTDPCRKRFPCCQQEGYKGPFEYVVTGEDGVDKHCGCFKQPSGSSLFPESRLLNSSSVRAYQLLAAHGSVWREARSGTCWAADSSPANMQRCKAIAEYGLNSIPSGVIWNEPFVPGASEQAADSRLSPETFLA